MKIITALMTLILTVASVIAFADGEVKSAGARAMVISIEAEITAIDSETNEVTIKGPQGNYVTVIVQERVVQLSTLNIGDRVAAEYVAALEAEVREPTEEELTNPWEVVGEQVLDSEIAAAGVARQIRAVCTIEAADRDAGFVMIKDSRGKLHTIEGVRAERFDGVTLGDTVVVVYTEALALGLERVTVESK